MLVYSYCMRVDKLRIRYFAVFVVSGFLILIASLILVIAAICLHWDDTAAQWVSAIGEWVSGIFAGGALIFTGLQVAIDIKKQEISEDKRIKSLSKAAQSCAFRLKPGKTIAGHGGTLRYKTIEVVFTNKINFIVSNICVKYKESILAEAKQVNPGARQWGSHIMVKDLKDLINKDDMQSELIDNEKISCLIDQMEKKVKYYFEIEDIQFVRINNKVSINKYNQL